MHVRWRSTGLRPFRLAPEGEDRPVGTSCPAVVVLRAITQPVLANAMPLVIARVAARPGQFATGVRRYR